jgi:glutamyl-Q tRNA(Asp) synthetase
MTPPVFRFAPSPNGRLHLGHAYSALLNARFAERLGGRLLLRLEDIDVARCTPDNEAAILADLAWLGLAWEEPVRRQSEHFDTYAASLRRLEREGLVYPSFLTRGQARDHVAEQEARGVRWPRDPDGAPLYPALDRELSPRRRAALVAEGRPFSWRLDMDAALSRIDGALAWSELSGADLSAAETVPAAPQAWGDVVLGRRDVPTSYHLSVVVDDALQEVTHVVRGRDLYHATSVHRLLQALLGLRAPAYHHHALVTGADGRKLSKSAGDTTLAVLRQAGATRADVLRRLGLDL